MDTTIHAPLLINIDDVITSKMQAIFNDPQNIDRTD